MGRFEQSKLVRLTLPDCSQIGKEAHQPIENPRQGLQIVRRTNPGQSLCTVGIIARQFKETRRRLRRRTLAPATGR